MDRHITLSLTIRAGRLCRTCESSRLRISAGSFEAKMRPPYFLCHAAVGCSTWNIHVSHYVSVVAVGTIMGALSSIRHHRTLYARKGRKGEIADPEDKIGPFIQGKAQAYSCDYSLFEMEAGRLFCQKCDVHGFMCSVLTLIV